MSYRYELYPIPEYILPSNELPGWSSDKANELYQRFLDTKRSRVIGLLWYLNEQNSPFGERELVERVSTQVRDLLLIPLPNEFATALEPDVAIAYPTEPRNAVSRGDLRLTPIGNSIAVDLAILLADTLAASTAFEWQLYKNRRKRDANNGFPVIYLDEDWKAFNPFVAGRKMAERAARGAERAGNEWLYQYDRLENLAKWS